MSKLAGKAKNSKLNKFSQENIKNEQKESILNLELKVKEYPRSYRLDYEAMNTLKDTLIKINEITPKKISETRLVKALIILSKDLDKAKIIKALKEVW